MPAKPTSIFSGRFQPFLDEFDTDSVLKAPSARATTEEQPPPGERDLVAILMEANKDVWDELLNNDFCKAMKEAGNDDQNLLRGFEWYMKQDYFYVSNLIKLEESRVPRARTAEELKTAHTRIGEAVNFADVFFTMLTGTEQAGLGMDPKVVLATPISDALEKYIELINTATSNANPIFSYVVMIACYQSYNIIAADLYRYSIHQDTLWYEFWAKANYSYGSSCLKQQKFFIDNYDSWNCCRDEITKLFRDTCESELSLWKEALENSK